MRMRPDGSLAFPYWPIAGPMRRSDEPLRFQALPLRSEIPKISTTTTGYCAPGAEPGTTMVGLPSMAMTSSLFGGWPAPLRVRSAQLAFAPQMMSAIVFERPPLQVAGPAFVALPQSLSVTRRVALLVSNMDSLKSITIVSPASRVFAPPADPVSAARVDVGATTSPVA